MTRVTSILSKYAKHSAFWHYKSLAFRKRSFRPKFSINPGAGTVHFPRNSAIVAVDLLTRRVGLQPLILISWTFFLDFHFLVGFSVIASLVDYFSCLCRATQ